MNRKLISLAVRSILFYKKKTVNQIVIILILSAVITGSLLTGYSVRTSLKNTAVKKLGNTGYIISSGLRYFDSSVSGKLRSITGTDCVSLLEAEGTAQKFDTNRLKISVKIYGITHEFFRFHGTAGKYIGPGEAAINKSIAIALNLNAGDEMIVNHRYISDLPSGAPFAPSLGEVASHVFRVKYILEDNEGGNFSLGISQTVPGNVFVNILELSKSNLANRILVDYRSNLEGHELLEKLGSVLKPSDIGLKARKNDASGTVEILYNRIFFPENLISEIKRTIPEISPVITYLANNTVKDGSLNPYSFISGVEPVIYPEIPQGDSVLINRWLADDIDASAGDTIIIRWFNPEKITDLKEEEGKFIVAGIVDIKGIWSDRDLMPDFPGIAGQVSCTRWDAGVKLRTELIRKKDEEYWNIYGGTPKIFINYEKGKQLWGNNFGPATALRVPGNHNPGEIIFLLTGKIDPVQVGFRAADIRNDMLSAASQGVDFSSLFIGLSFFILISCLLLLSLSVTSLLDSRREEIFSLFATGFRNKNIFNILLFENLLIAITGSFTGALSGILFNSLTIKALNTVWRGAVQTDTITASISIEPVLAGFGVTVLISVFVQYLKVRTFLNQMEERESRQQRIPVSRNNLLTISSSILLIAGTLTVFTGALSGKELSVLIAFLSGGMIFAGLIILFRRLLTTDIFGSDLMRRQDFSRRYYSMYPARAVLPVLLIASGLFAIIATGVNRLELTGRSLSETGGTGGFLIWAESPVPVKENLNSPEGRRKHGLNYGNASEIYFLQAKRLQGDDASCLNLNHVTSPPLLGLDIGFLSGRKAFSFASLLPEADRNNPWKLLEVSPGENCIYGFADQTVLQWGLRRKTGDTLTYTAENGEKLHIIIAGGLKSSVFQGYIITGEALFSRFFPSATGYSVFLAGGNPMHINDYMNHLRIRFENYGMTVMSAGDKLSSFFEVTNTYLSVFMILGALGMLLGVLGLGFVLRQNYAFRKREFALMLACGYNENSIKKMIINEQLVILLYGVITGFSGSVAATLPSTGNLGSIPWLSVLMILIAILLTGISAILIAIRNIKKEPLVISLRKE